LPISRVSAIPACIYFICQYLPLERVYGLTHPSLTTPPVEDKRTWRAGTKPSAAKEKETITWTAMDVLTAYADKKGWVTAKAGRPDVGRAGNASKWFRRSDHLYLTLNFIVVLRAVAEGRVRWAFWPPNAEISCMEGNGIWTPHATDVDDNVESSEEDESEPSVRSQEMSESEEQSESEEEEEVGVPVAGVGRFGALVLDDSGNVEDEENTEDSQ